ncbi:MAG: O-antigen ligase family protein [bacterium]
MISPIAFKTFLDVLILSLIPLLVSIMGGVGFDFAVGNRMVSLHSLKNVLIATILFWIIKKIIYKESSFIKTSLNLPVLIYLITFLIAVVFSSQPKVSFLYFRDFILYTSMVFLLINNIDNKNKLEAILFIFLISVIYTSARGTIQHVNSRLGYDDGNYYSFGGRAEFGAAAVLTIPVLAGFLLNYRKNLTFSIFFVSGLIILITGMVVSYSRGSWIGFIAVILFFILMYVHILKNWRFFVLTFLTLVFLFLIIPSSLKQRMISIADFKNTTGDRISAWKSSLAMIKDFPFLGIGPGTYDVIAQQYKGNDAKEDWTRGWHAHNIFLHVTSENGLIGLFSFLLIIFISFKKYFELQEKINDIHLKNLLNGTMASLGGYLVCSQTTVFFANHNKNEKISMFLWFDIALIFIIENIAKKQDEKGRAV